MNPHNTFIRRSIPVITILLTTAVPARADSAREIVDKVRTALGLDAFESQGKAVRVSGPLKLNGLDGTHTFTFDAEGRFRKRHDAMISTDTVFDGKIVRHRDVGDEVCDEALGDRTNSLMDCWSASGLWFAGDRGKSFKIDDDKGDGSMSLTMDLDDGRKWARVFIDRQTWLPRKWVYGGGLHESTILLGDYQKVGSLRLPKMIRTQTETGAQTVTSFEKVELIDVPDWKSELKSIQAPDNASFSSGQPADLEVKKAPTGHLLVHPLIGGKDIGWFIFDTGAGVNVLDTRAAIEAGLKTFGSVPAVGIGGHIEATFCRPTTLKLGQLTLEEPLAVVMDLAFLDQHMGVKIGGVVGYGTLARCVAEVDVAGAKISLHDPGKYRLRGGKWSPLIVYDRVPCVPGRFEDHEGTFRLDTGAGGHPIAFHAPTVKRLKLLDGRETDESQVGGVGGMKSAQSGEIETLEFGGRRHENVSAVFATEPEGAFADSYIDANIGVALIGKSVIVLDYPHSRIAFKPKPGGRKKNGGKAVSGHTAGR
jgi:hypothetical protein